MTKYAILHGNYNIYHAEFETYEEAKEYYDELVKEDGTDFDLQLCKVLETHEAPEREAEMAEGMRHQGIDFATTLKKETKLLQKIKHSLFGR